MNHKRIAIAGFQHETNTFAPGRAGMHEFSVADSWPALLRGDRVIGETRGLNLPISGAVEFAEQHGVELISILWCAAEPSGPVTSLAFESIAGEIESAIGSAARLDAIYLDLHGAMVTERYDDGEAELLRRLRAGRASDKPIAVSLDLHANISSDLVNGADLISVYRRYPHLDMAQTGARCMQRLLDLLDGRAVHNAFRQSPFLVPLHAQYTGAHPCQRLYQQLQQIADEKQHEYLELAMGFTAADIADCGPAIIASAANPQRAAQLADTMLQVFECAEQDFNIHLQSPKQAVRQAMQNNSDKPVVIADVQDNAGAGGTADTTGLLQALIDEQASDVVIGVICDPSVAELAHSTGIGRTFSACLAANSEMPGNKPVAGEWLVQTLSDGYIPYSGEMYAGVTASIGKSCLLSLNQRNVNIQVVVSSYRTQCLDQALFTHFGIVLSRLKIIVVKSTVHFRADFEPIADTIISAAAPGAFCCDLGAIDYRKLRRGIRLGPLGKTYGAQG